MNSFSYVIIFIPPCQIAQKVLYSTEYILFKFPLLYSMEYNVKIGSVKNDCSFFVTINFITLEQKGEMKYGYTLEGF